MYLHIILCIVRYCKLSRSGPVQVQSRSDPQGPVHSLPGPEPAKWGLVQLSLAQTLGPPVRSGPGPRSVRARTKPQTV
jgi:hypothetical protein